MVVSELRGLLKKYKEEDLRLLLTEMYKAMPKKLREEKDIDALLQDVHAYLSIGKTNRKQDMQVDINTLRPEVEQFIDFAYKQYYFAPNNYIHKKERPKWRFKVKEYVNILQVLSIDADEGKIATNLLEKLYSMLSYACGYYIFNTENPFRSVGIEQVTLLDTIIKRKLGNGISKEIIKSAIELVINNGVDRETLYSSLMMVLLSNLKSTDSIKIAIEQCLTVKAELEKPKPSPSKKSWTSDLSDFRHREKISNIVEMVFRLNMALCEYEEAIRYYKKYNCESSEEISLYVLLHLILEYKLKDYWLAEYEKSVREGVKARQALQKTYQYIKENDKLPEYQI